MTSPTQPTGSPAPASALGHLRVLDLTGPPAHLCGKLLADLGADVIKLEPPEGDSARGMAPFAGDACHPEGSLRFAVFNTNKRSVTLDLPTDRGRRVFRDLARDADVVLESFRPGYLDSLRVGFRDLARLNPRLVFTSITTFGQTGPYRGFQGGDLIAQAMGGLMYIQGDDTRAPCAAPEDHAYQLACLHAAGATLAALHARRTSGSGQSVDVSVHDVAAHLLFTLSRYAATGTISRRSGTGPASIAPNSYYRCADGAYACLCVFYARHWDVLAGWMNNDAFADPVWRDAGFRRSNPDVVDEAVADFVGGFESQRFLAEGQARHLAVSEMNSPVEWAASPHPRSRGFFVTCDHPRIGPHAAAGAPYRLGETPWRLNAAAPFLGQHQEQVLGELREGAATHARPRNQGNSNRRNGRPPLEDVRIVDFTRVWAGPFATRYLAELGAQVVKIETQQYLDVGRERPTREPTFPEVNRSKLGITLNFQEPEGKRLVEQLVGIADVVLDNFAAGVLERRGLGYEALRRIKPDVIVVSMPGYGRSGPFADRVAYGQNLMSAVGLSYLWGHPESPMEARPKVHYGDFVSAASAAMAVLAALEYRDQTGRGQFIEVDQSEALAATLGVPLADYFINGRRAGPRGNRNANAVPHGCYPCAGGDQWCVIECWDEAQWHRLREAMGSPAWANDSRFSSSGDRRANEDELDERIGVWTRDLTPHQAMRLLQRAGVPAAAVQTAEHLYHDVHLRARGFVVDIEHPGWGRMEHPGIPVTLPRTRGLRPGPVPALGQHNDEVFARLLGMAPARVRELTDAKVMS